MTISRTCSLWSQKYGNKAFCSTTSSSWLWAALTGRRSLSESEPATLGETPITQEYLPSESGSFWPPSSALLNQVYSFPGSYFILENVGLCSVRTCWARRSPVLRWIKQSCTRRLGWISEKPLALCCPVPVLYLPVIHCTPRGDSYYCKTSVVW